MPALTGCSAVAISACVPYDIAIAVAGHVGPCAMAGHRYPALWCHKGGAPVLEDIICWVQHGLQLQQCCRTGMQHRAETAVHVRQGRVLHVLMAEIHHG